MAERKEKKRKKEKSFEIYWEGDDTFDLRCQEWGTSDMHLGVMIRRASIRSPVHIGPFRISVSNSQSHDGDTFS